MTNETKRIVLIGTIAGLGCLLFSLVLLTVIMNNKLKDDATNEIDDKMSSNVSDSSTIYSTESKTELTDDFTEATSVENTSNINDTTEVIESTSGNIYSEATETTVAVTETSKEETLPETSTAEKVEDDEEKTIEGNSTENDTNDLGEF